MMLAAARACGVHRAVVVLGYRHDRVRRALAESGAQVDIVLNDDYAHTNTLRSLCLACPRLNDNFLYFNADVLFDTRILPLLLEGPDSRLAVHVKPCGPEDVKVIADPDGRVRRIGKDLNPHQCLGEFIGIAKFARDTRDDLADAMACRDRQPGGGNLFFEAAVDDILRRRPHWAVDIGRLQAVEIDTPDDLDAANRVWQSGSIQTA